MRATIAALFAVLLASHAGCGATTPVWYEAEPGRTSWTLPLIDPLADAELVVPAFVHDAGPYLFLLDPHAPVTVIDRGVAEDLGLYFTQRYERALNQRDVTVPRRVYEILALRAGELRARKLDVIAAPAGTLHAAGRRIDGVLGSDLLSRTIVIDVDRDAGVARLALTGHEQVPAGATRVPASLHRGLLRVDGSVGAQSGLNLIVELARATTALHHEVLADLGVALAPAEQAIYDYTGDRIVVSGRARIDGLTIGGALASAPLDVIPYEDRRGRRDIDYQGWIGQNLLSRYRVVVDRDDTELWLAPRAATLAEGTATRLARWGDALAGCAHAGCAALRFDPATRTLAVARDAAAPPTVVVTIQALDAAGAPVGAPLLKASLSAAAPEVTLREPGTVAEYAGAASFEVVDAAPL